MNVQHHLELITTKIRTCTKCPLHKTRKNAVPGEGPVDADLMLVGEAPGAKEDELGRPFVGRSGKLLVELLESIGLTREEVFITSILKSRPPNNRSPLHSEIQACLPYLESQIAVIKPKIIVLLGGVAISTIIGPWLVKEAHGRFYEAGDITFFMTYHPAAALRFPKIKEVMQADFQVLRHELGLCGS